MFRELNFFLFKLKNKIFGQRENDVQYVTRKGILDEEHVDIDEGKIEVEFSEQDENGIIIKEEGVEEKPDEKVAEKAHEPEEERDFTYLNCPDLSGHFSVVGIRDGDIHMLFSDEIGTGSNVIIEGVFKKNGGPKVKGIVVRRKNTDLQQHVSEEVLGYIDLTNYIGINAKATVALEDLINENILTIHDGNNEVPEEIRSQIS